MINFTLEKTNQLIQRADFFEPNLNQNILNIEYDNQGNYWTNLERKNKIKEYKLTIHPYRNIPNISIEENNRRNIFKKYKKRNILSI